jgi:hypothetical protein
LNVLVKNHGGSGMTVTSDQAVDAWPGSGSAVSMEARLSMEISLSTCKFNPGLIVQEL